MNGKRVEELQSARALNAKNCEKHRMLMQNSFQLAGIFATSFALLSSITANSNIYLAMILAAACTIALIAILLIKRYDNRKNLIFSEKENQINSELENIVNNFLDLRE